MEGIGYLKRKLVIDTYASFRIVVFVESNSSVNSQFMLLFFLIKKKVTVPPVTFPRSPGLRVL